MLTAFNRYIVYFNMSLNVLQVKNASYITWNKPLAEAEIKPLTLENSYKDAYRVFFSLYVHILFIY